MSEKLNEGVLNSFKESMHALYGEDLVHEISISLKDLFVLTDQYFIESNKFAALMLRLKNKDDRVRLLHEHIVFRKGILSKLDLWVGKRQKVNARAVFSHFESQFDHFILTQPSFWIVDQPFERFNKHHEDSLKVSFFKLLKRTGYSFSALPVRSANLFRKLLKKDALPDPVWKQKIPIKKLSEWYYKNYFLERYLELKDQTMKETALLASEFWEADHRFFQIVNDVFSGAVSFEDFVKSWESEIHPLFLGLSQKVKAKEEEKRADVLEILKTLDQKFDQQLLVAGTLEFQTWQHSERKKKAFHKRQMSVYSSKISRRNNTLFALADDWKFNQEIYILKTSARKSSLQLKLRLHSRAATMHETMQKLPLAINESWEVVKSGEKQELRKNLSEAKYLANKSLNSIIIPQISDLLLDQGFPLVIDETEQTMLGELYAMTGKRILIDGFDPSTDYSDKSMQSVIPLELVEFEMMNQVKKVILSAKTTTIEKLETIKTDLESLGRMVVFGIDSAIVLFDEMVDNPIDHAITEANLSMSRALENYDSLRLFFDNFIAGLVKSIDSAIDDYSVKLTELTDNSRVADIRYRITKAKAIKRSNLLLHKTMAFFQDYAIKFKLWYSLSRKRIDSGINVIRDQLGIQHLPVDISFEISDYLVSGDETVKKLPFVYRRLFLNEPLKDATFYYRRVDEVSKLEEAWLKWMKGSFTPVLLTGERGSGVSTFLQMFVKEKIRQNPIVYSVMPGKRIQTEEELLALLGFSFQGSAFLGLHELTEFVEKQERFVVVVDKLQFFYLRVPGGFNVLKKLFEIISQTSRKIFWICTSEKYASNYLQKTIGLHDYFPVLIPMKSLNREDVRRIIMLRHKASGYELVFKPSVGDLKDRSYERKNNEMKQNWLREKYFETLNQLTQSNISFALQIWLRSSQKEEGSQISLNSLDNLDFGFMFNLPKEVVFGLHALLLHERLDVFQLSMVLSISKRQAYLLLMRLSDRGIVSEENGYYSIHRLLYRQAVTLLQERNLIH
jgi:hypothetical protein